MSKRYNGGFISAVWTPFALHGDLNYLWSWGQNSYGGTAKGMLGDNTIIDKSSPVQIGTLNTWSSVTTSTGGLSGALKTDGTMWLWGRGDYGQLGKSDVITRSSPVQVGALTTWSLIAVGTYHSMALKTDGAMWSWGNNTGNLGDGTTTQRSSPVQIGALTTWSKIAGGSAFSMAVKTNGTLWLWGVNYRGQLGINAFNAQRSSPVQIGALTDWLKIAARNAFSMAIKTDNTMWSWGENSQGQLGLGDTNHRSSPVQVGGSWSSIAAGGSHTMAISTDGTLWAWGNGQGGRLSNNNVYRSTPGQIGALTTWSQIAAGSSFSIAIKTDGTMWLWGSSSYGALGQNNTVSRSSPVQIGALYTWSKVAASIQVLAIASTPF